MVTEVVAVPDGGVGGAAALIFALIMCTSVLGCIELAMDCKKRSTRSRLEAAHRD